MARYTVHLNTQEQSIFNELRRQTDRAAAVLGGALVDEALNTALTCLWRNDKDKKTREVRDEIIPENGGPLTFGVQIGLAYLIGLIGPSIHAELKIINKVRNKFAHRTEIDDSRHVPQKVTFDTQSIKGLCGNLQAVDHIPVIYNDKTLPTKKSRHRYLATCIILSSTLHLYSNNPTKRNKAIDGLLKS